MYVLRIYVCVIIQYIYIYYIHTYIHTYIRMGEYSQNHGFWLGNELPEIALPESLDLLAWRANKNLLTLRWSVVCWKISHLQMTFPAINTIDSGCSITRFDYQRILQCELVTSPFRSHLVVFSANQWICFPSECICPSFGWPSHWLSTYIYACVQQCACASPPSNISKVSMCIYLYRRTFTQIFVYSPHISIYIYVMPFTVMQCNAQWSNIQCNIM